MHEQWDAGPSSLQMLHPFDALYGSFGTSFATPIVSSVAGHVWQSLDGNPDVAVAPHMVKALLSTATVIADAGEQDSIGTQPLRALPALYPREAQLPHEPVEPQPPSQPELLGVEPPPLPPCAWARSWTWLLVRSSKNAPAW